MGRRFAASSAWRAPLRLATAAAVVLAVGMGLVAVLSNEPQALASEMDFTCLLDALPFDAESAFGAFVAQYHGRRTTALEAKRFASKLNFAIPDELPGGFNLKEVFVLRVGAHAGVAARYDRQGQLLAAIFHPPVRKEDFGSHKDYPCVIGQHRGHMVAVDGWKMVHVTDPTTCHCVLSQLDDSSELPAVLAAVAPLSRSLEGGGAEGHEDHLHP